jgi:hypothetical protein
MIDDTVFLQVAPFLLTWRAARAGMPTQAGPKRWNANYAEKLLLVLSKVK